MSKSENKTQATAASVDAFLDAIADQDPDDSARVLDIYFNKSFAKGTDRDNGTGVPQGTRFVRTLLYAFPGIVMRLANALVLSRRIERESAASLAILRDVVPPVGPVRFSDHVPEQGEALMAKVQELVKATKLIAEIEEEARRAGLPPGWIR